MEEDLGTAASAVGRYQVAWALGCRSYYSFGRRHNNDEIILTRNDTGNVYACRDYASLFNATLETSQGRTQCPAAIVSFIICRPATDNGPMPLPGRYHNPLSSSRA